MMEISDIANKVAWNLFLEEEPKLKDIESMLVSALETAITEAREEIAKQQIIIEEFQAELEKARKDTERIDFCSARALYAPDSVAWNRPLFGFPMCNPQDERFTYPDARSAIDAAMELEKKGGE